MARAIRRPTSNVPARPITTKGEEHTMVSTGTKRASLIAGLACVLAVVTSNVGVSESAFASARSPRTISSATPAMLCVGGGEQYVKHYRPSECAVLGRSNLGTDCDCGGSSLKHLVWTHWGRPVAYATGREETLHTPEANLPARITLSGLRHGPCGSVYTRLTETSRAVQEYEGFPEKAMRSCWRSARDRLPEARVSLVAPRQLGLPSLKCPIAAASGLVHWRPSSRLDCFRAEAVIPTAVLSQARLQIRPRRAGRHRTTPARPASGYRPRPRR